MKKYITSLLIFFGYTCFLAMSMSQNLNYTNHYSNKKLNIVLSQNSIYNADISSLNRINFYAGVTFAQVNWGANAIEKNQPADLNKLDYISAKAKNLKTVLTGSKAQTLVISAMEKLKTTFDYDVFAKEIGAAAKVYYDGLGKDQKWYYKLGNACGETDYGMKKQDRYMFILTDVSFETVLKEIPAGVDSVLISAIKETALQANSKNYPIGKPEMAEYKKLYEKLGSVFKIIGSLKEEDFKNK